MNWTPQRLAAFWRHVEKSDGCWNWTACVGATGYGNQRISGKTYSTHRLSWLIHHGEIPSDLCVLHRCDNPRCVRPDHLFLGTRKDNYDDCVSKGRNRRGIPARGSRVNTSKLQEDDVRFIRAAAAAGAMHIDLAKKFGVTPTSICSIVKRRHWAHLAPTNAGGPCSEMTRRLTASSEVRGGDTGIRRTTGPLALAGEQTEDAMTSGKRITRACENCGREFSALAWRVNAGGGKYCSVACVSVVGTRASMVKRAPAETAHRPCASCGVVFSFKSYLKNRRVCSPACRGRLNGSKLTGGFAVPKSVGDAFTCSMCLEACVATKLTVGKRRARCERCIRIKQRRERDVNPSRAAEVGRKWRAANRKRVAVAMKRWSDANQHKTKAHRLLHRAIRKGRIVRQPCQSCGASAGVHAHHEDYSKPLDVQWLCRTCHGRRHRKTA